MMTKLAATTAVLGLAFGAWTPTADAHPPRTAFAPPCYSPYPMSNYGYGHGYGQGYGRGYGAGYGHSHAAHHRGYASPYHPTPAPVYPRSSFNLQLYTPGFGFGYHR